MSHREDLATAPNSSTDAARPSRFGTPTWLAGASALDVFAGIVAFALPVAIAPAMDSYTFTPKLAVLLVLSAVGLPQLVRLACAGERVAWAAVAFLAVALVSAATSGSVLVGLFGMYLTGTGWFFWCAVAGAWALGRSLRSRGTELVTAGLVAGAVVNALVTIAQQALQLDGPVLGLYQGTQADGLMGNPIFLESVLLGALAIALVHTCAGRWRWALIAVLLSASLELSGERFAIALLGVLAAWALVVHRNRSSLVFTGAIALGYVVTYGFSSSLLHERIARNVVSNPRVTLWKSLFSALAHHPILGFGPAQTLQASTAYGSLALARRLAVATYFTDAHDVLLEVAVTTGLIGLTAFVAFAGGGLRASSGPLLGAACMALAVEFVEPLNVGVTPLAFLALGAAAKASGRHQSTGRGVSLRLTTAILVACAICASGAMLYGDYELNSALLGFRYPTASRGAHILSVWSAPALIAAEIAENRSIALPDRRHWLLITRHWHAVAVSREPTNTQLWAGLAGTDAELGNLRTSASEYATALRLDRFDTEALVGLARVDAERGQRSRALELLGQALATAPGYSPAAALRSELDASR